jgi:hypothetical protein
MYMLTKTRQLELLPIKLESDYLIIDNSKPYILAADNNNCKEELDKDTNIKEYFASFPNKYKTHEE